jgi:hypothetical protein
MQIGTDFVPAPAPETRFAFLLAPKGEGEGFDRLSPNVLKAGFDLLPSPLKP